MSNWLMLVHWAAKSLEGTPHSAAMNSLDTMNIQSKIYTRNLLILFNLSSVPAVEYYPDRHNAATV